MYELTPEGDTPLFADIQAGIVKLLDDEQIADMYYLGKDFLESCGYIHYEISNFAQPTYECRHNINYWDRGGYLGIGASAHSFINDVRCANVSDVDLYIEGMRDRRLPIAEKLAVDRDGTLKELFMLGLRKTEGIMLHAIPLERRLSIEKAVEELIIHGLAALKDGHLKLTRKGLLVSNEVIVRVWSHIDSIHS
jgi:oxygen-independent coproporphyrinogen-3 oxidase